MSGFDPKRLPLGKGVRILADHACGLLALSKPPGILSHPNRPGESGQAVLTAPYNLEEECYEVPAGEGEGPVRVWLLNRLDSATSGVLLCSLDSRVAEVVRREFSEGRVRKTYYALVFGSLAPRRQLWRDRLRVSREEGRLRTSSGAGLEAETEVGLERFFPGRIPVSLLELRPKTGRTHQLRVQCAQRKLPIVGDQTYGNFAWNREFSRATGRKRLFLHSAAIGVDFVAGGRPVAFFARAPLPKEFTP